jgi:hypothetical protein
MSTPLKAAGDTVAETLTSFMDTAATRGRRARKDAQKRVRDEVGHQRRNVGKAAKKTRKQTQKAWADFADETAARAGNIVEASKGGRVAPRGRRRRVSVVLALGGAVAIVVVLRKRAAPEPDEPPSRLPSGQHAAAVDR